MNKIDLKAIVKETLLESIQEADKELKVSGPKGEVEFDDKAATPENLKTAADMVSEETIEEVVKKMMEANPSLDERRCRNKVYEYYLSEDSDIKDAIMSHAKKQLSDVFDFAKVALRGEPFMGPSMEHDLKQMMMDMIKGVRLSPKTKHLKEDDASQLEAIKTDLVDLVRDLASHFQISNEEAQDMACDMIQGITISEDVDNIPNSAMMKINQTVKQAPTMAKMVLDFIEKIQEKESIDFSKNSKFNQVLSRLRDLSKDVEDVEETINEVDMSDRDTVEAFQDLEEIAYDLKEMSKKAKEIMRNNFPMAYEKGQAYGLFNFGGGGEGRYAQSFEKLLRDIEEGYED